jgi:hypothetical protein
MPRAGFEPTIAVFERARTFRALDRADTVIGTELCEFFYLKTGYRWLDENNSKIVLVLPASFRAVRAEIF